MIFFLFFFRIFNWTKRIFLREANLSVFGLAIYMLHPLFGKARLAGFKTLFR